MFVPVKLGVDIASTDGNGDPDWALAKAKGPLAFVIIRACEGTWKDPDFERNWAQAKFHGVKRGAYVLLRFGSGMPPEAQIDTLFEQLGGTSLSANDLPPTIDLEFPMGRAATGFSAAQCLDWFLRARRHFRERAGFEMTTYTSYVVWVDPAQMANPSGPAVDLLRDTPWWIKYWPWPIHTVAHTDPTVVGNLPAPPCPPPAGDGGWAIEQTQGDAIKFPGFVATVDVDRFNVLALPTPNSPYPKGAFVAWVQRRVGKAIAIDGVYGPNTVAAVKRFQLEQGLVADGIVGPDTFGYLAQVAA